DKLFSRPRRPSALAWIALLLIAASGAPRAQAADPAPRFAAPAAWVRTVTPEYGAKVPPQGETGQSWYLLVDRQINVRRGGDDQYLHIAVVALNAEGVEDESQINLSVDPAFET